MKELTPTGGGVLFAHRLTRMFPLQEFSDFANSLLPGTNSGQFRQRKIRLQAPCIRIYYTMRETVTISLPKNVRRELDRVAKQEGVSRSDVLRQSLEEFLFARRFRALRARMMAAAQAQRHLHRRGCV